MRKIDNFDSVVPAGESKPFPIGPQPCVITKVEDMPDKSMLYVEFDVAQGEMKGHFKDVYDATGKWYGTTYRSYRNEAALRFFKAFITAVEKSNVGYRWNWDEKTLVGKYLIVNFREEEYVYDGEVRTNVKPFEFRSIEAWKEGSVDKNPPKLTLKAQNIEEPGKKTEPAEIPDDELPF